MKFKKLNNDEKIPFVSYGVYEIKPRKTKKAVLNALNAGYTSIDNAQIYSEGQISPVLGVHTGPGLLGIGVMILED